MRRTEEIYEDRQTYVLCPYFSLRFNLLTEFAELLCLPLQEDEYVRVCFEHSTSLRQLFLLRNDLHRWCSSSSEWMEENGVLVDRLPALHL